jgi:uncharacterized protein (TIGR03083 family)
MDTTANPLAQGLLHVGHDEAQAAFLAELDAFLRVAGGLDDCQLLAASRCRGWNVVDVIVHVHLGLQDMLLDIVTRTDGKPDTDAASYWQSSVPTNDIDADRIDGMRFIHRLGAAYRRPAGAIGHLRPTARGIHTTVAALTPGAIRSGDHVLATGDFLATWTVELAVHHFDLGRELELEPPVPAAVRLARVTVEALAGGALPASWPDEAAILVGTGRMRLDPHQRQQAGALASRLPVLS